MSYEDSLIKHSRDIVKHTLIQCCPSQHRSYKELVTKVEEDVLFVSEFMGEAKMIQQKLFGLLNSKMSTQPAPGIFNGKRTIGLDSNCVKDYKTYECALLATIRNNLFSCLFLGANSHCKVFDIKLRKAALLSDIDFISETIKSCAFLIDNFVVQLDDVKQSQAKLRDKSTKDKRVATGIDFKIISVVA